MSSEESTAVVLRMYELMNSGEPGAWLDAYAPDAKAYGPGTFEPGSPADWVGFVAKLYDAFPDFTHQVDQVVAKGDIVVVRATLTGTHTGEYLGMPPTGKTIKYGSIVILRVAGGKIVESWSQADNLWMMRQLGMELRPSEQST